MPGRAFHKPITPDLSPNIQGRDTWFGLRQLLLPWNWPHWKIGNGEDRLSVAFREPFGTPHAFTFDSGRIALHGVIRALHLQPGDEVVIQSFTCVVVPDAIIAAGVKPVYVDIDYTYNIDLEALKRLVGTSGHVKAVIAQHTFGQPAAIKELAAFCKEKGLFLIEDCAHSLGAKVDGKLVGTFGDAAIFSFGRDKVMSTVSGGVAITMNPEIAERLNEYESTLPYPSRRWIAQRLAYPFVFEVAKWLYYVGPIGKMIIEISKRLGIVPLVIKPAEKSGKLPTAYRMPNVLAAWAARQMEELDAHNAHRREIANIYAVGFAQLEQKKTVQFHQTIPGTEPMWLRWSIEVEDADKLRSYCKEHGIILGSWYDTPVAPRDTNLESIHYPIGSCPRAERLGAHIVNLPTNINTSIADAQNIVDIIKKYYA